MQRFAKFIITGFFLASISEALPAQDAQLLLQKVRNKMSQVKDYTANGILKTNVTFLKIPVTNIKAYFKSPDQLRIRNEKGFSFIPKGAVNINLYTVLNGPRYSVLDMGRDKIFGKTVRVVKLLPEDDNADVILSTVYINEADLVIVKTKTTTRDNGTFELEMSYGKYLTYGLPDKIVFTFNAKDYKLPKGVTFDFDDGTSNTKGGSTNRKGRAEISFSEYIINKGIPANVFQ